MCIRDRCDAYEGPGNVVLPSGVADTASSINISAKGRFLGKGGASHPIKYGDEIADLRTIGWNDRVEEVQIDGGEVCLFNNPTGAQLGILGPQGHVGWAFEIGDTTTWEFGATEGNSNPVIPKLTDTHSWSDMGSWNDVQAKFKSGGHYTQY